MQKVTPGKKIDSNLEIMPIWKCCPLFIRSSSTYAKIQEQLGRIPPKYKKNALLACLAQRPSARLYCCGGQLLQATLPGPCRACLVAHPWQLVPYAALGLGRDGANDLA